MERTVQFEVQDGKVIVRSKPRVAGTDGVDLYATLEAMEVCLLSITKYSVLFSDRTDDLYLLNQP